MRGIRFVPEESNINFIDFRFLAYMVSFVLIIGSIGMTTTQGLNLGIDFTGGTLIEIKTPEKPDLAQLRTELNGLQLGVISIQEFGAPDDLLIRLPEQKAAMNDDAEEGDPNAEAIELVKEKLGQIYELDDEAYRRIEFVGPQVGEELKMQGLFAILFSLAGILAYIWLRFEWQFGVAAIVALAHDAIATIGLFALTQMEFNLSTVAAILMIAGYSINDTVVVFDRIRENLRKYKKKPLDKLFNYSVNQTLGRTLMTSITTLLALLALYFFGGEVIRGFVYALIFGIVIGTYSSIFVASPVLMIMNIKRPALDEQEETTA
tara:strand:+ start:1430 stop:2389 length:960 start_codon:yes stop_codon:yes gene_type:complete